MILLGAAANAATVAVGGFVGLFAGKLLPERLQKSRAAKNPGEPLRVLSIGSCVGYMERVLLEEIPEGLELYVNEPSTVGMKWMRRLIPGERIFIGLPPDCLSPDISYDMIYHTYITIN